MLVITVGFRSCNKIKFLSLSLTGKSDIDMSRMLFFVFAEKFNFSRFVSFPQEKVSAPVASAYPQTAWLPSFFVWLDRDYYTQRLLLFAFRLRLPAPKHALV